MLLTEISLTGGIKRDILGTLSESCMLGWKTPDTRNMLVTQLKSSSEEKDVGVLVGTKLNMSQQCVFIEGS